MTKVMLAKAYQPYGKMTTQTLNELVGMKKGMARQLDIEIAVLKSIILQRG